MTDLRLPPVDVYRQPLVEPLGYMVLHSAWFENRMFSFLALLLPFGPDTTMEQVAHELRFWNRTFIEEAVEKAIIDRQLIDDIAEFLDRVDDVRDRRHRLVHDAMEVGVMPAGKLGDDQGWQTILLREQYSRSTRDRSTTERKLTEITPAHVAEVAMAFYELGVEIDEFEGRLKS